jgi:hypothetical protein
MTAIEIDQVKLSSIRYSICTLVTNLQEYQLMLNSYKTAGFGEEFCEYIYIDNSRENKYDAYEGLNKMISAARGQYIILCHQDIELKFDGIDVLEKRIAEIEGLDKNWGIIANAGGLNLKKVIERISHPTHELNLGPFPMQVKSVDENFILLKKSANLGFSRNMKGYHMYGTDICILANATGYNAWVVDFHLLHKSNGVISDSFIQNKRQLITKYNNAFRPRYIRSTCTKLYISGNKFCNLFMNTNFMIFFAKLVVKAKKRMIGNYNFE